MNEIDGSGIAQSGNDFAQSGNGVALLCDIDGNITQVLRDPFGLGASITLGMPFARLAVRGSLAKALSFLTEIKSQGAAFDWEINIALGESAQSLHFTGGKVGENILVVGAENGKFAITLYEEMMRISNEQTNTLRAALKDLSRDSTQYDEISRLNNELVDMQRELAKKNADLARLNQEKNRFLGMAAHDLRNPLAAIIAYSDFLAKSARETMTPDQREFIEVIAASSKFMAQLIEDLLDVSAIEAGRLDLNFDAVRLGNLVTHCVNLNQVLAARKQIDIHLITEPLPTAVVDSAKIEQVLNNLISNAVKFSQPGGKVEVHLQSAENHFLLSVKDTGPGIPPEELPALFKPFQRGHKGTGGEKSTGLGLAIVKRIVEGHGGKIWLESVSGIGTTFFVSIPLQPNPKGKTVSG